MFQPDSSTETKAVLLQKTKHLNEITRRFVNHSLKAIITDQVKMMIGELEDIIEELKRTDMRHGVLLMALSMEEDLKFAVAQDNVEIHHLQEFLKCSFILQNRLQAKVDPRLCEDEIG